MNICKKENAYSAFRIPINCKYKNAFLTKAAYTYHPPGQTMSAARGSDAKSQESSQGIKHGSSKPEIRAQSLQQLGTTACALEEANDHDATAEEQRIHRIVRDAFAAMAATDNAAEDPEADELASDKGAQGAVRGFTNMKEWNDFCQQVRVGKASPSCVIDFAYSDRTELNLTGNNRLLERMYCFHDPHCGPCTQLLVVIHAHTLMTWGDRLAASNPVLLSEFTAVNARHASKVGSNVFQQEIKKCYIVPGSKKLANWQSLFLKGQGAGLTWVLDKRGTIPRLEDKKFASLYHDVRTVISIGETLCSQVTVTHSLKHTQKVMRGGQTIEYEYIVAGIAPASAASAHVPPSLEPRATYPSCKPAPPPDRPVIMFLGINTTGEVTIEVQREYKCIRDELEMRAHKIGANQHDLYGLDLDYFSAPKDLFKRLGNVKPSVVHLACHGQVDGLHFYESFVKGEGLLQCLQTLSRGKNGHIPRVVVLNACDSLKVACELANCVEFVIGHEGLLPDKHAIVFSEVFYAQLAQGSSVSDAFDVASISASDEGYKLIAVQSDPGHFALFPTGLSVTQVFRTLSLGGTKPLDYAVHINLRQPAGNRVVREMLDAKLQAWLGNSTRNRIAVWGLGGSGKSTLAMQFLCAERDALLSHYKVVAFLRRSNLAEDYLKLAKELCDTRELASLNPYEVRDKVHCLLRTELSKRWIIALDDLVSDLDEEMLEGFPWDYGKTIITTRLQQLDRDGKGISVSSFSVDEACKHVLDVIPRWGELEHEKIVSFVQTLELYPLAIGHAVEYCRLLALQGPEMYFERLKQEGNRGLHNMRTKSRRDNTGTLDEYPDIFDDVIWLCIFTILNQDNESAEGAIQLLKMLSYLDGSDIPMELFSSSREMLVAELQLLRSQSLVTINDEAASITMHPLTQKVVRDSVNRSKTQECLLFLAQSMLEQIRHIDRNEPKTFALGLRYSPHVSVFVRNLDPAVDIQEDWKLLTCLGKLVNTICSFLHVSVCMFEEARQCLQDFTNLIHLQLTRHSIYLENAGTCNPGDHVKDDKTSRFLAQVGPCWGTCLNNIGSVLKSQGKHREALDKFQESLAILMKVLGPGHVDVAAIRQY